ncbi:MAG: cobaltochelatase subunit CobN [Oceanospirillaceae bacterium]
MHLLAAKPGGFVDEEGIIDLDQSPADIIILTAADSQLAALSAGLEVSKLASSAAPSVRIANWLQLLKPAAFDLYEQKVLCHAKLIVVSLLGGQNYWSYGFERLCDWAKQPDHTLILVPGDDSEDPQLTSASNVTSVVHRRVWRYLRESGVENAKHLLHCLAQSYFNCDFQWREPQVLPRAQLYMPASNPDSADDLSSSSSSNNQPASLYQWQQLWAADDQQLLDRDSAALVKQRVAVLFYRSHLQSANTQMFDQLIDQLRLQGLNPLPIAIASLKDPESITLVNSLLERAAIKLILNTTGFASNRAQTPELSSQPSTFISPFSVDIPVLQLVLSSSTLEDWQEFSQGLRSRDVAMQVALPELDGRVLTRAISFKSASHRDALAQVDVVRYQLHHERANFVITLAKKYLHLASKANEDKVVALILANYPTKDGRIGNGVGLDTPNSCINILNALQDSGYQLSEENSKAASSKNSKAALPENGNALIEQLLQSVTNNPNTLHYLGCWQSLDVATYRRYFSELPTVCQQAVIERWGDVSEDHKFRDNRIMIAGIRFGSVFVGIQPARGFNIDLLANYHDPDLVPPHSYLAFYFWLRHVYQADAVVHVGKHGNLEWLPGKGLALSAQCWPDIALGPMPHFYPFIVNDPGEGAQAKRRAQAVVIDHLMPPMARAETYGELAELEALVDEYYQALGMDSRREIWLRDKILEQVKSTNVLDELNLQATQNNTSDNAKTEHEEEVLNQLDTYLCDIKEAQIRHGLHILGQLPAEAKLVDTIIALLRLPRGKSIQDEGLLHNMAADFKLMDSAADTPENAKTDAPIFNPSQASTVVYTGPKPVLLVDVDQSVWRTQADTRERLELLAVKWVTQYVIQEEDLIELAAYPRTATQLEYCKNVIKTVLERSVEQEISALIGGLAGKFVEPGPSGAPTRGRLDTLPTGRNFFSLDNRSVPSNAAWALGQKSAQALLERHLQEHGEYPQQIGLSVWGTATMRTGGDDIAQAFALMGVRPVWAPGSQRVVDIEVIPCMQLGRPRVDVTLRVSGFFRDAFANVMKLYDTAVQAICDMDDPGNSNVIARNVEQRTAQLIANGLTKEQAQREASYRVFGSKPGAYGAGLQGLIDERCWEQASDLSDAYLNWGGYAYTNSEGDAAPATDAFAYQLSNIEVVVQNQDNREHDILDSDDYYQFQGGMSNAVKQLSGTAPAIYHSDHSNPEQPQIRTLKEELNRVIRSRVLNPKWISAMREHGYKGAFEMTASVDYMFAYDATTNLIDDYQYKKVADTLLFDEQNQQFLQENNPHAMEEMAERLLEATQRGLWENPQGYDQKLQDLLLTMDEQQEMGTQS